MLMYLLVGVQSWIGQRHVRPSRLIFVSRLLLLTPRIVSAPPAYLRARASPSSKIPLTKLWQQPCGLRGGAAHRNSRTQHGRGREGETHGRPDDSPHRRTKQLRMEASGSPADPAWPLPREPV
ncbi:hypothetical protein C8Q77DRAFT_268116 [Trametes polyzona]|nr:hypothetical protein C8Q77DRAFT_268116 [Trametes polyzona]